MKIALTAENLPAVLAAFELPPETPLSDVMAGLAAIGMVEEGKPEPTEETPVEPAADKPPPPAEGDAAEKPEDEEPAAALAAAGRLFASTGKTTFSAAIDETEVWKRSHLELAAERTKLARDREALEAAERRELYGSLVVLGKETPATMWKNADAKQGAVDMYARMPIADLRKRVAAFGGSGPKAPPKPPTGAAPSEPGGQDVTVDGRVVSLSAREVANCKAESVPVEKYAARKLKAGKA